MIEPLGAGRYQVGGPLTFATVAALRARSVGLIVPGASVTFELSGVTEVDSAALALIIEWLRTGTQRGATVRLRSVPPALRHLARVYDCDELAPELGAA